MKNIRREFIEETNMGIYLWEMPTGGYVADDEGNFLSIASMRDNPVRIKQLIDTVKSLGIEGGKPVFMSGVYKIDDEEYEYQKQRMQMGLTPDPLDWRAIQDEQEWIKQHGNR